MCLYKNKYSNVANKKVTMPRRGLVGTTVTNMNRIVDNSIFYLVIKGLDADVVFFSALMKTMQT